MIGVILAGGLSTRMGGGDKSLLKLGGTPVLDQVINRLKPQVAQIAINANGNPERFIDFGLPVVSDTVDGFVGPLAGVLAGMEFSAQIGADQVVTVAADTPFYPTDLVAELTSSSPFSMAATQHPTRGVLRHPTFALWPVSLKEDLRHALLSGVRKVVEWSDQHDCQNVLFDTEPFDPFFNVNTPNDMKEAERLMQEHKL